MRTRSLFALLAATIVLVLLAVVASTTGEHAAAHAPPGELAFPGLAAKLGQITKIDIRGHHLRLDFVRAGDNWLVADKGSYPAAAQRVRQVALALADMTLVERMTREPKLYARLAVERPGKGKATLVTLRDQAGKALASLIVGKRRYDRLGPGKDGLYVRKPGHRQSWLAAGSLDFAGGAARWLNRRILNIPANRIAEVRLTQPNGQALVLSRATPTAKFTLAGAPAGKKLKGGLSVNGPPAALAALKLEDVRPAAKSPIPAQGVATATFRTFDGLAIALRIATHGKTVWIALSATGSGKTAAEAKAIDTRVAGWVYRVPAYTAGLLQATEASLLAAPKAKS